jgi:acyl-CoA synthetase (AMP-forming)/AMP-acid ligase II
VDDASTNLATAWEAIAGEAGDAPAVIQGERVRRWEGFSARAARLAGALAERGVGPSDKVAICCYNSVEYLETVFAAFKLRAAPVNVNYRYREAEIAYVLEDSGARAAVFHAALGERVAKAAQGLGQPVALVTVADGMGTLGLGGRVVLCTSRSLDPDEICRLIGQHRVTTLSIVGDVFAKPILAALDRAAASGRPYDLSSLERISSVGVTWSPETKRGLLRHGTFTLIDGVSATEGAASPRPRLGRETRWRPPGSVSGRGPGSSTSTTGTCCQARARSVCWP